MGLRYIPPGKKSYKNPPQYDEVVHENQHDAVVENAAPVEDTAEVIPLAEVQVVEEDKPVSVPAIDVQKDVEAKAVTEPVVIDTPTAGIKRKK